MLYSIILFWKLIIFLYHSKKKYFISILKFVSLLFSDYIEPFLNELSPLAQYTVKSQWLYFVTLNVQPKLVTDPSTGRQHYALAEDILPQIITPLEKKLGM